MKKRFLSSLLVVMLLSGAIVVKMPQEVFAYQNSAYYNNIRIGLKSMASTSLTITLNGVYSINGTTLNSGTSYPLTILDSKVVFNGVSYDNFTLVPNDKASTVSIKSGTTTNKYLGNIQFKVMNGLIFPIDYLGIEDYLKGVVGTEMSDYYPIEALKAQAVSARNYTLSYIGLYNSSGYDLTDTPETQAYKGYNESYANVIKAVNDTRGMVQLYNDSLIQAYYSASNGGYEESSDNVWVTAMPYLKFKTDSYDNNAWPTGNLTFTSSSIDSTLKSKGYLSSTDKFVKIDLSTITRYPSGRVSNIDIIYTNSLGTQMKTSFSKTKAYSFLGLPSSLYTVTYNSSTDSYLFSGKGFGHGVGLSQLGAKSRAESGQAFTNILGFYFDGSYTQNLLPAISNFSLDKTSTIVGQAISVNAASKGGSGSGYLYKYVVTKDNAIISTQNYSDSSTFNYSPSTDGNYNISLYVLDKLSNQSYDDTKTISFTAYKPAAIQPIVFDKTATLINQPVTVNTSAADGSGSGYQYKFAVSNSSASVYTQDFGTSNTLQYTPAAAGTYTVDAYVKDGISTADYDSTNSSQFTVYSAPQIANTSFAGTLYEKRPVTISSKIQYGSTSMPSYKFEVYSSTGLVASQDFTTSSSYRFTPSVYGSYTVKVYVRDGISTSSYDDVKQYSLSIQREPVVVSTLPISYGMRGNDVVQVQTGLTNLGYSLGTIDGIFGSKTYNAVVSFQKSKGLSATGVVDQITLNALNDALISKTTGIY